MPIAYETLAPSPGSSGSHLTSLPISPYNPEERAALSTAEDDITDHVLKEHLLISDRESFEPSREVLKNMRGQLVLQITVASRVLLDSLTFSGIRSRSPYQHLGNFDDYAPIFPDGGMPSSFLSLCRAMYGLSTHHDIRRSFDRHRCVMKDFVPALLAATIFKWVFLGGCDSLPPKFDSEWQGHIELRDAFEGLLPPHCYDQTLLKARQKYTEKEYRFPEYAVILTGRFQDLLRPFLIANGFYLRQSDIDAWNRALQDVLIMAFRISAQLQLREGRCVYICPQIGNGFDTQCMKNVDNSATHEDTNHSEIKATLFPTVVQVQDKGDGQEAAETLLRAVVRMG